MPGQRTHQDDPSTQNVDRFAVSLRTHLFIQFVHRFRKFWLRFADFESAAFRDKLDTVQTKRPIYIAGLARSGSTILLETLAATPQVATHQYQDFPPIFTPYWWNTSIKNNARTPAGKPSERAHGDGIMVTPQSPEALEEPLWMAFFNALHDPASPSILNGETTHPKFEAFYRDHLRKILLVRPGDRYTCKGNYHIARLEYLLRLFPDARFIIPIRSPITHIASLTKQHRLFCLAQNKHPRARSYLRHVGHFEFGLDRRPINLGDTPATSDITNLWDQGQEVRGWARYWHLVYQHVADLIDRNPALRQAALIVRYEDLCQQPKQTLARIFEHCHLTDHGDIDRLSQNIHFPTYYKSDFSQAQQTTIQQETQHTAARFGYEPAQTMPASRPYATTSL